LSTALLALMLGSSAQAEQYSDADANFQVTVPSGWQTGKITNEYVKLIMMKGTDKTTFGICTVVTQQRPETKQLTQAQIDAKMVSLIDEKFWQFALTMSPGTTEATLKSSNTEIKHGRNVYSAVMGFKVPAKDGGEGLDATAKEIILVIPGQFYFVTCLAPDTGYGAMEGDFNVVFDSFGPISDTPVAANEAPSVSALTLYSGAKFAGVSRVVTQDTPDLSLYGWRQTTASASVSGAAPWEMCSGANYAGDCRVVSGALGSSLGRGAGVLSARRVPARDPAILARSLQNDVARAIVETVQRAR
jgi:hypothetical protein